MLTDDQAKKNTVSFDGSSWLGDENDDGVSEDLLNRYSRLEVTKKRIELEIADLKLQILQNAKPGDKFNSRYGSVTIQERLSYAYSSETKDLIKKAQKEDIERGRAVAKTTQFVRFDTPKNL